MGSEDPALPRTDLFEHLAEAFGLTREQLAECGRIREHGSAGTSVTLSEAAADRLDALRGRPLAEILIARGHVPEARRAELERALQVTVRGDDLHATPRAEAPTRLGSDLAATPVAPVRPRGGPEAVPAGPVRPGGDPVVRCGAETAAPPLGDTGKPTAPVPPSVLGRYRLVRELGRGGMGVVYLAHDGDLRRDVALKQLLAGERAGAEGIERFLREARAAAGLTHPGIAQVYDVGVADGEHFITMELATGGSLAHRLRNSPRPTVREAAELVQAIAEAVAFAHERGVVHRDLKPENVLLDDAGRTKVSDFGLARVVAEEADGARRTRSGAPMGTPAYMAPEQAAGEVDRVGPASDVYALGVMLYEMTVGRLPYPPERPMALLVRKLQHDPPRPRTIAPSLARDAATIIEKAMERDPGRRYPTARELADDLARFLGGEIVHARPATVAYRTWSWVRRHRGLAAGIAVALAAGLALVGVLRGAGATRASEARLRQTLEDAGRAALGFEDEAYRKPVEAHGRRSLAAQPAAMIDALLRERPDDAQALAWRGWIRGCLGADAEARADFARACALAPDGLEVLRLRGTYLLERVARLRRTWITLRSGREGFRAREVPESEPVREDRRQGVRDLERFLTLAGPVTADAPLARALVALYSDAPGGAAAALRALEGLDDPRAETLRCRAEAALRPTATEPDAAWGHANRGIWAARRGLAGWSGSPALRCDHGFALHVYEALADRDAEWVAVACEKAEAEFGEALRLAPEDVPALLGRAQARWLWALTWWQSVPKPGEERPVTSAEALANALADLDAAAKLLPEDPWPHALRADVRIAGVELRQFDDSVDPRADLQRAIEDCAEALRRAPGTAEFLASRAFLLVRLARAESGRGGDPRGSRSDTAVDGPAGGRDARDLLLRAVADAEAARRAAPEWPEGAAAYGAAVVARARVEFPAPAEAVATVREAIAALDLALAADPAAHRWRLARGAAWRLLGEALRAAGESPYEACDRALADLKEMSNDEAAWERALASRTTAEAHAQSGLERDDDWWRVIAALRGVQDASVSFGDPAFRKLWFEAHARWFSTLAASGIDPCEAWDRSLSATPRIPGMGAYFLILRLQSLAQLERGRHRLAHGGDAASDLKAALEGLTEELERNSDGPAVSHERGVAAFLLAQAAYESGHATTAQLVFAESDLRAAIAAGRTEAWVDLAEFLAWAGRGEAAIAAFESAAALPGKDAWARVRIAEIRGTGGAGK